jgi:hypothetical protein
VGFTLTFALVFTSLFGIGLANPLEASAEDTQGDDGTTNWEFIVPVTHQTDVPEDYTPITTPEQLSAIDGGLSGKYILMNDIDLSGKIFDLWRNNEKSLASNNGSKFAGILSSARMICIKLLTS